MRQPSKRSAASVTGSRRDIFAHARLRLTSFYVLVIAAVVAIFSSAVYFSLAKDVKDSVEEEVSDPAAQEHLVARTKDDLQLTLVIVDGLVLVVSGFLGYALAGRTLRPIRKALEAQRDFSSQASHELRTPLTVMKTESELALRAANASPEELREVLRSNVEEVGRMTEIVGQLLAISRGGSGPAPAQRLVDAAAVSAAVCDRLRPLAEAKGLRFVCDAGAESRILGDDRLLEQAVTNLVQNGINYTPRGGAVSLAVGRQEGRVTISVADTGVGIAKDDLSRIFDPFYTGRHDGKEFTQGAGLGLAIVKRAVTALGGEVGADSEVGKGTTMTIAFREAMNG